MEASTVRKFYVWQIVNNISPSRFGMTKSHLVEKNKKKEKVKKKRK